MVSHSSTLAWKILWMEEPGRLRSMGSLRVRHDSATSLFLFTFMHWRRKWQPIPVFLPGESQGWGSRVGCHLWGRIESDTTRATQQQQQDSQESSPTPQFKSINSLMLSFLLVQLSHPCTITGKTIVLTRWTFVGTVMSLLLNKRQMSLEKY